jgi:hypothetical protein
MLVDAPVATYPRSCLGNPMTADQFLFTVKAQNEEKKELQPKGIPAYIAVMFICRGYLVAGIVIVNT